MKYIDEINGAVKVILNMFPNMEEDDVSDRVWRAYNGDMDKRQLDHIVWLQFIEVKE